MVRSTEYYAAMRRLDDLANVEINPIVREALRHAQALQAIKFAEQMSWELTQLVRS